MAQFFLPLHLNRQITSFPLGISTENLGGVIVLGMAYSLQRVSTSSSALGGGSFDGSQVLEGIINRFCGCLTTLSTWVLELTDFSGSRSTHLTFLNYKHNYWMNCIAKFLLLTLDKQRLSNWSRTATTGLHGEKMLNDTCGTAPNANKQRIHEIRHLDYWNHYQYLNNPGNTYPWISNHSPKIRKGTTLPLWTWW